MYRYNLCISYIPGRGEIPFKPFSCSRVRRHAGDIFIYIIVTIVHIGVARTESAIELMGVMNEVAHILRGIEHVRN